LNFGSDDRVRNAFRATLVDEPSSANLGGTKEIDRGDVLEVTDLANAIAKAEEAIRARSSRVLFGAGTDSSSSGLENGVDRRSSPGVVGLSPSSWGSLEDVFDKLGSTDDASGPAVHAPYIPTPMPPRATPTPMPPIARLRTPSIDDAEPPISSARVTRPLHANATQPLQAMVIPPAPTTAPLLVIEDDAYYHPAGHMRSLADATLESYRPDATSMLRLRERRSALSKIVGIVLALVALLAVFAGAVSIGRARTAREAEGAPTTTTPGAVAAPQAPAPVTVAAPQPSAPAVAAPTTTRAIPTLGAPAPTTAPAQTTGPTTEPAADGIPVFDVKSLKNAPPARPRR
jgi:hypothetical protein